MSTKETRINKFYDTMNAIWSLNIKAYNFFELSTILFLVWLRQLVKKGRRPTYVVCSYP